MYMAANFPRCEKGYLWYFYNIFTIPIVYQGQFLRFPKTIKNP